MTPINEPDAADTTPLVKRVVITGSECTGKTTLTGFLARHYNALMVHEYVREYAEAKGAPIDESDHWPIARGQTLAQQRALARARAARHRVLVLDTDLLSTVTYAHHYTGQCDPGIEMLAREQLADHYLLLGIDVPWRADGIRDRGDRREEMHEAFTRTLERFRAPYTLVTGSYEERIPLALRVIDTLLGQP